MTIGLTWTLIIELLGLALLGYLYYWWQRRKLQKFGIWEDLEELLAICEEHKTESCKLNELKNTLKECIESRTYHSFIPYLSEENLSHFPSEIQKFLRDMEHFYHLQ